MKLYALFFGFLLTSSLFAAPSYEVPAFLDESKSLKELNLITSEKQAKYLKLTEADLAVLFSEISQDELITTPIKDLTATILITISFLEGALLVGVNLRDDKNEANLMNEYKTSDSKAYDNILVIKRVKKAWGLPPCPGLSF
jgi:hypothetical protein